ncbi:alpha/beta hydrolase [Lentzea guizhouensis]|uniref:alpha/beta hydrolase n=1 Tax=Lentzea guizhouensis TaxID=1586287 RepID=UPI0008FF24F3|nr:alpha/beta hydrolase [Lentzea guizhouensis]
MSYSYDPQVAEALAPVFAAMAGTTPPPVGDVVARRAALEGLISHSDTAQPVPSDVTLTDHRLVTADGATLRLRWYARTGAAAEPGPAAVYYHGGGMILGHIDLFDGSLARYVSASGTPVLSVDYRRAPEHPHPTPVEDAYAGLVWLHEHAARLGVDPARIAVFGDSAGGGLAAAVSILARDRQGPAIAKQVLLMPMLDDRNLTPDPTWRPSCCGRGTTTAPAGRVARRRRRRTDVPATAAPARVADPTGLPPAYIEVGQLDIFRDEDMTYALRLSQAGVPVEFHLHPGVPHEFEGLAFTTDVARRVIADRVRVLASL